MLYPSLTSSQPRRNRASLHRVQKVREEWEAHRKSQQELKVLLGKQRGEAAVQQRAESVDLRIDEAPDIAKDVTGISNPLASAVEAEEPAGEKDVGAQLATADSSYSVPSNDNVEKNTMGEDNFDAARSEGEPSSTIDPFSNSSLGETTQNSRNQTIFHQFDAVTTSGSGTSGKFAPTFGATPFSDRNAHTYPPILTSITSGGVGPKVDGFDTSKPTIRDMNTSSSSPFLSSLAAGTSTFGTFALGSSAPTFRGFGNKENNGKTTSSDSPLLCDDTNAVTDSASFPSEENSSTFGGFKGKPTSGISSSVAPVLSPNDTETLIPHESKGNGTTFGEFDSDPTGETISTSPFLSSGNTTAFAILASKMGGSTPFGGFGGKSTVLPSSSSNHAAGFARLASKGGEFVFGGFGIKAIAAGTSTVSPFSSPDDAQSFASLATADKAAEFNGFRGNPGYASSSEFPLSKLSRFSDASTTSTTDYENKLVEFYKKHNPSKLSNIEITLAKYAGKEEDLFRQLHIKYGVDATAAEDYKSRLICFYKKHNPSKLSQVEKTLAKYAGRENELFLQLYRKYGVASDAVNNTASPYPVPGGSGPKVYMDLSLGGKAMGRIVMQLYADKCPLAAENFRALCTGSTREKDTGKGRIIAKTFEKNIFHRVVPNFCMQGGDVTKLDGTGGRSIYPPSSKTYGTDAWGKFRDEDFMQHSKRGLLSMANNGANRNSSQFFITLRTLSFLDGKHVVFGEVLEPTDEGEEQNLGGGMAVLDKIMALVEVDPKNHRPKNNCRVAIEACGELP